MIQGLTYIFLIFSSFLPGFKIKNKDYNHPLYIAVAQIDYSSSDKYATLLCKTFSDDLELALQKQYAESSHITDSSTGNKTRVSLEIEDYIKKHLQVTINGKAIRFAFMNFTKEDNVVSVNFRINNVNEVKRLEVNDTIFYELYDRQIQIVYLTVNGNRKSNRITNPESRVAFDF